MNDKYMRVIAVTGGQQSPAFFVTKEKTRELNVIPSREWSALSFMTTVNSNGNS